MGCEHANRVATKRILTNGILTVSLQCQQCGSGQARSMSEYNVNALPDFDESIKPRYEQELKREWEQSRAKFLHEQATHSGDWWDKYKSYLESSEWKLVRNWVLKRDEICQCCFSQSANQAHHLSYETYNKHGFTFPAECVGVCEDCHNRMHEGEPL